MKQTLYRKCACGETALTTRFDPQHDASERYRERIAAGRNTIAMALLELWDRPWSPTAMRFAGHALQRAWNRGIDILEYNA